MILVSIARRYARALLEVAQEEKRADEILSELEALQGAIEGSAELQQVVSSPLFSRDQRSQVLRQVAEAMGVKGTTQQFLSLLADRDRTDHISMIVRIYRDLADAAAGRVRALISAPYSLSKKETEALQKALSAATGKTVAVESEEDPSLLGGLVAKVGGVTFDGSIKTQLRHLRDAALA